MDPITELEPVSPQIYVYTPTRPKSALISSDQIRKICAYTHLPRDVICLLIDHLDEDGVDDPADVYLIFLRALAYGLYDDEEMGGQPSVRVIRLQCLLQVEQFQAIDALVFTDTVNEAMQWIIRRGLISVTRAQCAMVQYSVGCSYLSAYNVLVEWALYL